MCDSILFRRPRNRPAKAVGAALVPLVAAAIGGCAETGVPPPTIEAPRIALNEIMAANNATLADEDGDFDDWIELVNFGSSAIPLREIGLTDRSEADLLWIPNSDSLLAPGDYLLIWADGDDSGLHSDFKLKPSGEWVVLAWADGSGVIDSLRYPALGEDQAYARTPDATGPWAVSDQPTPGEPNQ